MSLRILNVNLKVKSFQGKGDQRGEEGDPEKSYLPPFN
jgi:hypothetical protein